MARRFRWSWRDQDLAVGTHGCRQPRSEDPAYDADHPVAASLDGFRDLPCTGRRETVRLDVFAGGAGDSFAPGQLVTVQAYTKDGPGGTGYSAPGVVVRLRR